MITLARWRVELTDEVHCYEVHGFQQWLEVFKLQTLLQQSCVANTCSSSYNVVVHLPYSFPVVQPSDG